MSRVPTSRRIAAAAGIAGALVGVFVLFSWQSAGWRRANFAPDYGGPVAPLAAELFILLGGALACQALARNNTLAKWTPVAAGVTTLVASAGVIFRARFTTPDFAEWRSGAPDFIGPFPIGNMAPLSVAGLVLAALGMLAHAKILPKRTAGWRLEWLLPAAGAALSSIVLLAYASGPPLLSGERLIHMALPAAVALLLLNGGLFILGAPVTLRAVLYPEGPLEHGAVRRHIALASLIVLALLAVVALVYVRGEQEAARENVYDQLDAIAQLKAAQVESWRREQMIDASFLRRTPALTNDILNLLAHAGKPEATARALVWIKNIQREERYESVSIFDATGAVLLSHPEAASAVPTDGFKAALARNDVVLTDFPKGAGDPDDPRMRLDLIIPIGAAETGGAPGSARAALVLRIDPRRSLLPLLAGWPVKSASAELILMRSEGSVVRYLNELRSAALPDRLRPKPWAGDAPSFSGPSEYLQGRDYRGIMALSALRRVGNSPWIVEAKVDQAEAYAPIREQSFQSGLLVMLILLAVVLAAAFIWRARHAAFLARVLGGERQRLALAERLALITENANDVILLFDHDMNIVEANERVRSMHGRSPEEMRRLRLMDLHPLETRDMARGVFERIFNGPAGVFETRHMRANGDLFPVEISARSVSIDGERFMLASVRDVTERKIQEAEIERLNRLYAALSDVNVAMSRADSSAFLDQACRALCTRAGFPVAWIARVDPASGLVKPVAHFGDPEGFMEKIGELTTLAPEGRGPAGRAIADNHVFSCEEHPDNPRSRPWREAAASFGFAATIALPIRVDGAPWGALCVYATHAGTFGKQEIRLLENVADDIGLGIEHVEEHRRRKAAEEASRVSGERLRLSLSAARQGFYDLDHETGDIVVSPEYALLLGYDPVDFRETTELARSRIHPHDLAVVTEAQRNHALGKTPQYNAEYRVRTKDGSYKWLLSLGRVVERAKDGSPRRSLGTITDITARKEQEARTLAVQSRLNATLDAIPDLMIEMGLHGEYFSVHSPRSQPSPVFAGHTVQGAMPPEAAEVVMAAIREAHESGVSLGRQFSIPARGTEAEVWFELSVSRGPAGSDETPRFIVLSRDITQRKHAEDALRGSLREKQALLNEVHHRVKNNLQVISSLVRLESGRHSDPGKQNLLNDLQGRVRSMALLHEALYRAGNFARVNLGAYLREVAEQAFYAQNLDASRVALRTELPDMAVDIDHAIPCGLIVNELISNCLKYAFPDRRSGEVRLTLSRIDGGFVRICVEDDGVGFGADFEKRREGSLGLQLVETLSGQIRGSLEVSSNRGARFATTFPEPALPAAETRRAVIGA